MLFGKWRPISLDMQNAEHTHGEIFGHTVLELNTGGKKLDSDKKE